MAVEKCVGIGYSANGYLKLEIADPESKRCRSVRSELTECG